MGLFTRKPKKSETTCSGCRYYVMLNGYGYCAKDVPSMVDVRLLSGDGIKRHCEPCPQSMTCTMWEAR